MSKCAALSFTNGIRIELLKWGVKVVSIEPHLFNTNLVSRAAQQNALKTLWQTSKPITRHDYGDEFYEGAVKLLDRGTDSARNNISDVVNAMYDAVTLKYPARETKVCSSQLERLRVWFMINILPAFVQDFLLAWGASLITGKPALVEQKQLADVPITCLLKSDTLTEDTNGNVEHKTNQEVYSKLRPRRASPQNVL